MKGHPSDYGFCMMHGQQRCKDCGMCHQCAAEFLEQAPAQQGLRNFRRIRK